MIRRTLELTILTALLCAPPAAAQPAPVDAEHGRCPGGHPPTGDLGIVSLVCIGGACEVNHRESPNRYLHDFPTEPRVEKIDPSGPAAGKLQRGDVLVAIDGVLITTREGGLRLANLSPEKELTLSIRRKGVPMDVRIVSKPVCLEYRVPMKGAFVLLDPNRYAQGRRGAQRRAEPGVDFGMKLECGNCGWFASAGERVWRSSSFPKVVEVEPGGPAAEAGIRPGDVLLRIERYSFTEKAAGELLGQLRPGQAVRMQLGRKGAMRNVVITPRAAGRFSPL